MKQHRKWLALALAGALTLSLLAGCAGNEAPDTSANSTAPAETEGTVQETDSGALRIAEQGIFSAGGTVIQSDGTFDVANYYTSREGWSNMFLRMGHSVWLIDQPRRGEAGQTGVAGTMTTTPSDQTWYTQFRIGTYLNDEFTYNEGSQFPQGEEVLDQFFRQMTPDTGMDNANNDQNIDNAVVAQAVATAIDEIYDRTGQDSILVTHSQGGLPGWEVPRYTDHVSAIVAIEPGGAPQVDSDAYNAMVEQEIPVTFYYGDYIGEAFTDVPAAMWSMMASSADTFTEAYNAAGGNSTVIHLPDEGITGNSHFMFQELNNDIIADHIEAWIQENVEP